MDQKSGKKPVNVNSETEEAENEMKKKTSKTVKSIAAVGFAVGGISAVQNFEAYAADGENTLEPEDSSEPSESSSGSDGASNDGGTSESNGGSNDSGDGESGDNSQNESGETNQSDSGSGEQEETNNTGNSSNSDGQVETNSTENSGNAGSQDDTLDGTNDTQGQPANDGVVKDAPKDSTETGPAAESTEVTSTEANASISDRTGETSGPVTTITTETTTKDSLNDDGTTTTTTTVTTTTEKSDGTVTSDTQTSTETKETTYQEVSEKDAVGPGVQEKYYKSEEGSDTADQEIEKDEYDKLINTIDSNGKAKVADTEYYYMKDGQEVPCTAADYKAGDVISSTTYYKPTADGGKKEISKDEYDRIMSEENGKVEVERKYYYFDEKGERQETDEAHYQAGKVELDSYTITYKDGTTAPTDRKTYEEAQENDGKVEIPEDAEYTYTDGDGNTVKTDQATYDANKDHTVSVKVYYKKDADGNKTKISKEDYDTAMADGEKDELESETFYYVKDDSEVPVTDDTIIQDGYRYYKKTESGEEVEINKTTYDEALKNGGIIDEEPTYFYLDEKGNKQTTYVDENGQEHEVSAEDYNKNADHKVVISTSYVEIVNGEEVPISQELYLSKNANDEITETKYYYYVGTEKKYIDKDKIPANGKVSSGKYKYYKTSSDEGDPIEISEQDYQKAVKNGNKITESVTYYYMDENGRHDLYKVDEKKQRTDLSDKAREIENDKVYTYYKGVDGENVSITKEEYDSAINGQLKTGVEYYYTDADNQEHTATEADFKKGTVEIGKEYYYFEDDNDPTTKHTISEQDYLDIVNNHDGKKVETSYYVQNGNTKVYVSSDGSKTSLTPEKHEDGKYYITDINGNSVAMEESAMKTTESATSWYIDVTTEEGTKKRVSVEANTEISLTKDTDGRYYYRDQNNQKLYVDTKHIKTYTSYDEDMTLVGNQDAALKKQAMDFLDSTAVATNFVAYGNSLYARCHIDGNICVNDLSADSSVEDLYAKGRQGNFEGLDNYSIVLNKDHIINFSVLDSGAVVIGTNINADPVNRHDGRIVDVNDSSHNNEDEKNISYNSTTTEGKIVEYLTSKVEDSKKQEVAQRIREEMDIQGNLDKIAAAGQGLIDYARDHAENGSVVGTAKTALQNHPDMADNEILVVNVDSTELNDQGGLYNTMEGFLTRNKSKLSSRLLINVLTHAEKDLIISTPLNGNENYSAYSFGVMWNFGEYNGTITYNQAAEGALFAPKATVNTFVRDGSVIADTISQGKGQEMHQSLITHKELHEKTTATASPLYTKTIGKIVDILTETKEHIVHEGSIAREVKSRDKNVPVSSTPHNILSETKYYDVSKTPDDYKVEEEHNTYKVKEISTYRKYEIKKHSSTVGADPILSHKRISTVGFEIEQRTVDKKSHYATVSRNTAKVEMESIKKDVTYEDHHAIPKMREHLVSLAKKFFKPVLNESHDVKVEKIPETPDTPDTPPETPDKPDTPDTPHDDHDTPDTPHDDHDTPGTPKEFHDRPDTPEVLGANREKPKEQAVLGATRPKVLGVTRAAKTGDVMNMARNGFAAAVGAVVLAVWGGIKALFSRKHKK